MSVESKFIEAIRTNHFLSGILTARGSLSSIEEKIHRASYESFLELQINLNARGDEWSAILKNRLNSLRGRIGRSLATGILSSENGIRILICVDSTDCTVLYYESI